MAGPLWGRRRDSSGSRTYLLSADSENWTSNWYSVPAALVRQNVMVQIRDQQVLIRQGGRIVASMQRAMASSFFVYQFMFQAAQFTAQYELSQPEKQLYEKVT